MLDIGHCVLPIGNLNCLNNQERKRRRTRCRASAGLSAKRNRICWGKLPSVLTSRETKVIPCLDKPARMKAYVQWFLNTQKQLIWAKLEVVKQAKVTEFHSKSALSQSDYIFVSAQLGKVFGSTQSIKPNVWLGWGVFSFSKN